MPIAVALRCSECSTVRDVSLTPDEKEIVCPVCGRRIENLSRNEHEEVEAVQKKQKMFGIISIVLFALAIVCVIMWAGDSAGWTSGNASAANNGLFIGAIVCGLVSMVLGILGSMKRFVVEF